MPLMVGVCGGAILRKTDRDLLRVTGRPPNVDFPAPLKDSVIAN